MVAFDILQVLDQQDTSLHNVAESFTKRYREPLISLKVYDPDVCIQTIEEIYKNYNIQHIDGLNIYDTDLRLTVRKSNTEPKIRIALETKDNISRHKHMDAILQSIQA